MGLEGTWYNELGSTLVVTEVSGNTVVGTYETATGGCAVGQFEVLGRTDTDSGGQTVGFSVTWTNAQSRCESTTSWAGEYQDVGGVEQLTALWLLVMKTTPRAQWSSTLVGEDVFTRQAAALEETTQARKRHSHP
jgi:avidin family protein